MEAKKQSSFLSIIGTNVGIIYKIAHAYCAHPEDRKDLIQEIVIQLWKSFDRYNDAYAVSTWMYRIALNTAISFYRKEHRRKQLRYPLSPGIVELVDASDALETNKQLVFLQQFIAELKELDKALLLLYLEEKSHKEIAGITGMSVTNVSTRIARIKTKLKQKFETINSK